jgi:hypothetical protein
MGDRSGARLEPSDLTALFLLPFGTSLLSFP